MHGLDDILAEHPFLAGLAPEQHQLLAGCARNHSFKPGEYVLREGDPADEFFLIRQGRIALEIAAPGRAPVVIATLGPGEIVGASWLVEPYRWMFDARAIEPVRAIGLDATCLRGKCDADPALGYEMMKRFLPIIVNRLNATRLQLLDVYG